MSAASSAEQRQRRRFHVEPLREDKKGDFILFSTHLEEMAMLADSMAPEELKKKYILQGKNRQRNSMINNLQQNAPRFVHTRFTRSPCGKRSKFADELMIALKKAYDTGVADQKRNSKNPAAAENYD